MKSWMYIALALVALAAWWYFTKPKAEETRSAPTDDATMVGSGMADVTIDVIGGTSRQTPSGNGSGITNIPVASRLVVLS